MNKLLIIVCLSGICFCKFEKLTNSDGREDYVVYQEDSFHDFDNETITIEVNKPFTFRIKANPSSGYNWNVIEQDSEMIPMLSKKFEKSKSVLHGAPGYRIFEFIPKQIGQTLIIFEYKRPFERMAYISVLLPTFSLKSGSREQIIMSCHNRLGLLETDIELCAIVPLQNNQIPDFPCEIGIRIHNTDLSMDKVEGVLKQRDNYKEQLQKTNEALKTYLKELKKMRKYFKESLQDVSDEGENKTQEAVKRALKYKQLEDDNKRLRQLLKTQLQNSENLRNETQQTVETLKEEFDLLVKEVMKFKQEKGKLPPGAEQQIGLITHLGEEHIEKKGPTMGLKGKPFVPKLQLK